MEGHDRPVSDGRAQSDEPPAARAAMPRCAVWVARRRADEPFNRHEGHAVAERSEGSQNRPSHWSHRAVAISATRGDARVSRRPCHQLSAKRRVTRERRDAQGEGEVAFGWRSRDCAKTREDERANERPAVPSIEPAPEEKAQVVAIETRWLYGKTLDNLQRERLVGRDHHRFGEPLRRGIVGI